MNGFSLFVKEAKSLESQESSFSNPVVLNQHLVSSYLIDKLADAECNWIGLLGSNWEIDLSSSLNVTRGFETQYLTIQELVPLTRQSRYQLVALDQHYWVHTLCLRVVGLGRVRLVLYFDNPACTGECVVLATDRLDWSPRNILIQWLHFLSIDGSNHQSEDSSAHSYSVSINLTSCSAALAPAL